MDKLVVLKVGEGSFEQGFPVILQIGEEGARPTIEVMGKLPPAPEMPLYYSHWQSAYQRSGTRFRLSATAQQITSVSVLEDCRNTAQILKARLNTWLLSEEFRPLREKLLERLLPSDRMRVIVQTEHNQMQRLPWHLLDFLERFPRAEIALSAPSYEQVGVVHPANSLTAKVSILAILGNSEGIDTQKDRELLEHLPDAQVSFLVEPQRKELTDHLWGQPWDILFFAGHSSSQGSSETGRIYLNKTDSLTIGELRYALRKAVEQGLKLAVFNSCDGLGLARELADLQIPQMIVMREPVPDRVAQEFLKYFLNGFSRGLPFYQAVREARERLQGLEDRFPCATWLPVICQNPAELPPTWDSLKGIVETVAPVPHLTGKQKAVAGVLTSLAVTLAISGIRFLGWLQPLELKAYDHLMHLRPAQGQDDRLLVITIDDEDIQFQQQNKEQLKGRSLSDRSLSRLLQVLEPHQPAAIGLDLYREAADPKETGLADRMRQSKTLIGVCKSSNAKYDPAGIAPPPEIPVERLGFTDFVADADGILRRHLLFMTQEPGSPCRTPYSFSAQLALTYLARQGKTPRYEKEYIQLGDAIFNRMQPRTGGYQNYYAGAFQLLLNYRSGNPVAASVSLRQVLEGQFDPGAIKDRIVLVGVTTVKSRDRWRTPFSREFNDTIPGVFLQAEMVSQVLSAVLDQRPLIWVLPPFGEVFWILGWALAGGVLVIRFSKNAHRIWAIGFATGTLYLVCFVYFTQAGWLPLLPAGLALLTTSGLLLYLQSHQVSLFASTPLRR